MGKWLRSLRDSFNKLAFAGLRPDQPLEFKKPKFETLLSEESIVFKGLKPEEKALPGPTPLRKKIIIVCGAIVVAALVAVLFTILGKPAEQAEVEAPRDVMPNFLPKDLSVDKNKELEVIAIDFQHDREPYMIVGTLGNRTGRRLHKCLVSFDLTTNAGSQLGGVATTIDVLEPFASTRFQIPVHMKNAALAMVRELQAE
jgi:hypothetical protein